MKKTRENSRTLRSKILFQGKFIVTNLFFIFLVNFVSAQTGPQKFWVQFTDKNNNTFTISEPESFLSARAIARRNNQNIEITEQDLPVTKMYTDSLEALGIKVLYTSKWFNAATIKSTDTALLDTLHHLSFVKEPVFTYYIPSKKEKEPEQAPIARTKPTKHKSNYTFKANFDNYDIQLKMLNGHMLHQQNLKGQGMLIAVIDGGFLSVDKLPAFENLRNEQRIIAIRNFVDDTTSIYRTGSHGMKVLSTMTGEIEGEIIGTAPEADYVLIQSEDMHSEYMVEADNWVAAAEYADSIGVDVINSSLGYHDFDDNKQDISYKDLNGSTMRNSLAADIAFSKGILVVTSAGNQGNKSWKYITTPGDAFNVLTIGAVDMYGDYASFSSVGPTADGRIKPNVSAMGLGTYVQQLDGSVFYGSGTSYSSPIMAGMCACLWQAFPEATNQEIKDAIEKSASQYQNPDTLMGYGIPDFMKAKLILGGDMINSDAEVEQMSTLPNPFDEVLYVELSNISDSFSTKVKIFSSSGRKVYQEKIDLLPGTNIIDLPELGSLPAGPYLIEIKTPKDIQQATVIKL